MNQKSPHDTRRMRVGYYRVLVSYRTFSAVCIACNLVTLTCLSWWTRWAKRIDERLRDVEGAVESFGHQCAETLQRTTQAYNLVHTRIKTIDAIRNGIHQLIYVERKRASEPDDFVDVRDIYATQSAHHVVAETPTVIVEQNASILKVFRSLKGTERACALVVDADRNVRGITDMTALARGILQSVASNVHATSGNFRPLMCDEHLLGMHESSRVAARLKNGCRHVGVLTSSTGCRVVSQFDLLRHLFNTRDNRAIFDASLCDLRLGQQDLVVTAAPDESLQTVFCRMLICGITSLPIVDATTTPSVRSVLSVTDITFLPESIEAWSTTLEERVQYFLSEHVHRHNGVDVENVIQCSKFDTLGCVIERMLQHNVRHVYVIDERLGGVVSCVDVLKVLC